MLHGRTDTIFRRFGKLSALAYKIRSSHLDLLKIAPTHSGNTPDHHGRPAPRNLPKITAGQAFGADSALGMGSERVLVECCPVRRAVDTDGIEPPTVEDALPRTPYISANLHARVAAFTGGPVDCCFSGQSPPKIRFIPPLGRQGAAFRAANLSQAVA